MFVTNASQTTNGIAEKKAEINAGKILSQKPNFFCNPKKIGPEKTIILKIKWANFLWFASIIFHSYLLISSAAILPDKITSGIPPPGWALPPAK